MFCDNMDIVKSRDLSKYLSKSVKKLSLRKAREFFNFINGTATGNRTPITRMRTWRPSR